MWTISGKCLRAGADRRHAAFAGASGEQEMGRPESLYSKEFNIMTNKDLVLKFYEEVFNGWDLSHVRDYVREDYIQHNPTVENGAEGLLKFLAGFTSMKPHIEIIKVLENEDHVGIFFKCTMGNGMVNKVMDIYRLEGGKLAEHWDILEHDVGAVQSVNGNSLF